MADAHSTEYEAMVIGCIDPRMLTPMHRYLMTHGLVGKVSQMMTAGAAIAAVSANFRTWRPAFWGNIQTSLELHHIKRLIVFNHRDCGACKAAYGESAVVTPEQELEIHQNVMNQFLREVTRQRHDLGDLRVDGFLMALDGKVEKLA
jgi:carbonic anhydrase